MPSLPSPLLPLPHPQEKTPPSLQCRMVTSPSSILIILPLLSLSLSLLLRIQINERVGSRKGFGSVTGWGESRPALNSKRSKEERIGLFPLISNAFLDGKQRTRSPLWNGGFAEGLHLLSTVEEYQWWDGMGWGGRC